jgi:hypothetical protein
MVGISLQKYLLKIVIIFLKYGNDPNEIILHIDL